MEVKKWKLNTAKTQIIDELGDEILIVVIGDLVI